MKLRIAARRISRFLEARMEGTGLSFAQFALLAEVAAAEDDSIGALAERLGLDPSTLSRNLRHLEGAGLLEVAVVEKDLRRRAVWLTEEGARRLERAIRAWQQAHGALAGILPASDLRRLADALDLTAAVTGGGDPD